MHAEREERNSPDSGLQMQGYDNNKYPGVRP